MDMSELCELTDRELDAVGGGFLNNRGGIKFINKDNSSVGTEIGQMFSLVAFNGNTFNF
jgi:hypothetical protein